MKVPGRIIRLKRLSRHLTQSQLASGICTQATVSLIENQNRCPSWVILRRLFERLHLSLALLQSHNRSSALVRSIDSVLDGAILKVTNALNSVDYRQFDRNVEKCQYFCCQAWLDLRKGNLIDSIHHFTKVLSLETHCDVSLYRAWANYGLAQINYQLKYHQRVVGYAREAYRLISSNHLDPSGSSLDFYLNVWLRIRVMKLWLRMKKMDQLFLVAKGTIRFLVRNHSMYKLSVVYMLMAKAHHYSRHDAKALDFLKRARVLAQIYKNQGMLDIITAFHQQIIESQ